MAMELNRLFRCLELKSGSPDEKIEGYLIAIHGTSYHALQTTVNRIIRGEIKGMSTKFCPTPPELSAAIREEMDFVQKQVDLVAERAMIADNRPVVLRPKNYEDRANELRARMAAAGRMVAFTVNSHDDFLRKRHSIPKGGEYFAITGECYGPPGWVPPAAEERSPAPPVAPAEQRDDIQW